ncbi:MAG: hypothetical protein AB7V48_01815 [Sedimentibacter sp.]
MIRFIQKLFSRRDIKKELLYNKENTFDLNDNKIKVNNLDEIDIGEDNHNDTSSDVIVSENNLDIIDVMSIKEQISFKINQQVGKLQLDVLEKRAWDRILKSGIKNENGNRIKSKLNGITPLLSDGELSIALISDISKEKYVSSACLQPFCNATEIMLYVSFILLANSSELNEFIQTEMGEYTKKMKINEVIKGIPKETLESVLNDYRHYRNTIAHTYQMIPIEAAYSFIQRTYENIQRLELLIPQS